mgnify:CR=1 FL=1
MRVDIGVGVPDRPVLRHQIVDGVPATQHAGGRVKGQGPEPNAVDQHVQRLRRPAERCPQSDDVFGDLVPAKHAPPPSRNQPAHRMCVDDDPAFPVLQPPGDLPSQRLGALPY